MGWTGARDAWRNSDGEKAWLLSTSCTPLTSMFSPVANRFVALIAPIRPFGKKDLEGLTPVIMVTTFD